MKKDMKNILGILKTVRKELRDQKELAYFWIHSVRYHYILHKIEQIAIGQQLKILDIGCFPYHVGEALGIMGHTVYGISSYHEPVQNKNIAVLNVEAESFPFKDNFFDLVLCNEVIEHLPQSPIPMLLEIYRVTKLNGFVMITTPNIARSINRAKLFLGKSVMYPIDVYFEEQGKGNNIYHRHNREYTFAELKILLSKTGWEVSQAGYFISYTPFRERIIPDPFYLSIGKLINYILMLLIPALRDTLFIVGRK